MNDWHNKTCDLLHPLYNTLRRHLLKSPYIHCDESAFSVYNEETHKVQGVSIWALSDALGQKADVNPREWMEDIMPKMKGIASNNFSSMEALLPGEWKKSHPDSRSMVHHMTEAEHVEAILKSRAKRKAAGQDAATAGSM